MKKLVLIILITFFGGYSLSAQNPVLKMLGTTDSNQSAVYLRWAPTNPTAWRLGNQFGYRLVRYTISRNGQPLSTPERIVLSDLLKPAPLNNWETISQSDNAAAIIAQALYGKTFQVEMGKQSDISSIVAQSEQNEQRFAFALMGSDLSFPAAQLAGLGYIDRTAKPNDRYFYQITSLIPQADSTGILIDMSQKPALPLIDDLFAQFGENAVSLSWNENPYKSSYTGYWIECSSDGGKTFKRCNKTLVSNLEYDETKPINRIYFSDSVPADKKDHHYRIIGQTIFGALSQPSNVVAGKSKPAFPYQARITTCYFDEKEGLQMEWELDNAANSLLQKIQVRKAKKINGNYIALTEVSQTQRKLSFKTKLEGSNYLIISLITQANDTISTMPMLVQTNDTTPPMPPQELQATIDTSGIVHLSWKANTEEDFLGYKIFRSMKKGEIFAPLTGEIYFDTVFTDTLNMQLSNPTAIYTLIAFDNRYNPSEFASEVTVKKPLNIPPSKPVFLDYKVENGQIYLKWGKGSQTGLTQYLFRRKGADMTWMLLKSTDSTYIETDWENNTDYCYQLALKNEFNQFTNSDTLFIRTGNVASAAKPQLERFYTQYEDEKKAMALFWEDTIADVETYQIYRSTNNEPLSLWKTLPASQKAVYDYNMEINGNYKYTIVAVLKSGRFSEMKTIEVKN